MRIALGADHRGHETIQALRSHLEQLGHEIVQPGPCDGKSCDYPDDAFAVGRSVAAGETERGILACGSGIGVTIAANKVHGIRAAPAPNAIAAEMSRRHNDANVLCLAADHLTTDAVLDIVDVWLATAFEGGRHARRVEKIMAIDRGEDPATIASR